VIASRMDRWASGPTYSSAGGRTFTSKRTRPGSPSFPVIAELAARAALDSEKGRFMAWRESSPARRILKAIEDERLER
jgi:hypothetical protein